MRRMLWIVLLAVVGTSCQAGALDHAEWCERISESRGNQSDGVENPSYEDVVAMHEQWSSPIGQLGNIERYVESLNVIESGSEFLSPEVAAAATRLSELASVAMQPVEGGASIDLVRKELFVASLPDAKLLSEEIDESCA